MYVRIKMQRVSRRSSMKKIHTRYAVSKETRTDKHDKLKTVIIWYEIMGAGKVRCDFFSMKGMFWKVPGKQSGRWLINSMELFHTHIALHTRNL